MEKSKYLEPKFSNCISDFLLFFNIKKPKEASPVLSIHSDESDRSNDEQVSTPKTVLSPTSKLLKQSYAQYEGPSKIYGSHNVITVSDSPTKKMASPSGLKITKRVSIPIPKVIPTNDKQKEVNGEYQDRSIDLDSTSSHFRMLPAKPMYKDLPEEGKDSRIRSSSHQSIKERIERIRANRRNLSIAYGGNENKEIANSKFSDMIPTKKDKRSHQEYDSFNERSSSPDSREVVKMSQSQQMLMFGSNEAYQRPQTDYKSSHRSYKVRLRNKTMLDATIFQQKAIGGMAQRSRVPSDEYAVGEYQIRSALSPLRKNKAPIYDLERF